MTPDIGTMMLVLVTALLVGFGSVGTLLYLFVVAVLIERLAL